MDNEDTGSEMKRVKCIFGMHDWKEIPVPNFSLWPTPLESPIDALHYCKICDKKSMRNKHPQAANEMD